MGFTQGTEGAVIRKGFFRGPLQIRIRGYDILIRRFEASGIEVEPVGDWPKHGKLPGAGKRKDEEP
jgi:ferrous iron transport protein A